MNDDLDFSMDLNEANTWWKKYSSEGKKDVYILTVGKKPTTDAIPDMWWRVLDDSKKVNIMNRYKPRCNMG